MGLPIRRNCAGFGSLDHVAELLRGWEGLRVEPDLAGIPRVIAARRLG